MVQFIATLIVLSFLGILNAGYLTWKHQKKEKLVCPVGDSCDKVVESKWSNLLGIRNEVLGVMYYTFIFLLGIINLFLTIPYFQYSLIIFSLVALLFSTALIYIQRYIIKIYCFYCLLSALITLLIFFNSLALF